MANRTSGLWIRVCTGNLFSLFLIQNICCGYSKGPSQWDGSFEHPKHWFKLMGKKKIRIFSPKIILIWIYGIFFKQGYINIYIQTSVRGTSPNSSQAFTSSSVVSMAWNKIKVDLKFLTLFSFWPRGDQSFFMLNSTEHKISTAYKN